VQQRVGDHLVKVSVDVPLVKELCAYLDRNRATSSAQSVYTHSNALQARYNKFYIAPGVAKSLRTVLPSRVGVDGSLVVSCARVSPTVDTDEQSVGVAGREVVLEETLSRQTQFTEGGSLGSQAFFLRSLVRWGAPQRTVVHNNCSVAKSSLPSPFESLLEGGVASGDVPRNSESTALLRDTPSGLTGEKPPGTLLFTGQDRAARSAAQLKPLIEKAF